MKSQAGTSKEHTIDVKKDQENANLWRGNTMHDSVKCDECGFIRCIFSKYAKGSKHNEGSVEEQEAQWNLLETWQDDSTYVCGKAVPVKLFMMRTQLRYYEAVESMYFSRRRNDICALCYNNEDVLTSEEVKYEVADSHYHCVLSA